MEARIVFRWLLAIFFLVAGANHFRTPEIYLGMMPGWLPWPHGLVGISGGAEMAGGIGILIPATRRAAGWGLVLLLIAVFPANLHVAMLGRMPGLEAAPWVLWLRLPFQLVFMLWVWWTALIPRRTATLD